MPSPPSALILSGGASRRMGRPKALLQLGDETFLSHLGRTLNVAGCSIVTVVLGAHADEITPHVPPTVRVVVARDWRIGMRASLRAGLSQLPSGPVLLTHVDRPMVTVQTVRRLIAASASTPNASILPQHGELTGHPVVLPACLRDRLQRDDAQPLNEILDSHPAIRLPVDDLGVHMNVNTPDDYARLLADADITSTPVA